MHVFIHLLLRREALYIWMQRNGSKATYIKLMKVFERAGYRNYADLVKTIIDLSDNEADDSNNNGDEQSQPQTYPEYRQQQALSRPLQTVPKPTETYIMISDEESLPEGISH